MQSIIGGIKVIYSRIGDTADSVIKRIISSERRQWIVITSDRDIAHHAWSSGSVPLRAEDFLNILHRKSLLNAEEDEDKEDWPKISRKGNPKRLSKKDRSISKVLSKL